MEKKIEQIASERGYAVTEEGELLNPNGKTIGSTLHNGYPMANLRVNKKITRLFTHRLQSYQKYGNKMFEEGIEVRHKDGNRSNNFWDNILIGTHSENMMDIPEQIRIKRAKYATSFARKYNKEEIKKFHEKSQSYKETMKKFEIKSKGSLHYILNN